MYVWVDEAPISKVKRNLNKDFADGSSIAEVIRHYLPESKKYLVDLSDYQSTVKFKNMKANWQRLNQNVLAKFSPEINFQISQDHIDGIVYAKFGFVERTILQIKKVLTHFLKSNSDLQYDHVIMEPFDVVESNTYR